MTSRGSLDCLRTLEHDCPTQVWLRSTAVARRSRSFLPGFEHNVDEVFNRFFKQTARRGLLDMIYQIDSTETRAMPSDSDASKNYKSTAEEYNYGYGCTIISARAKIQIAAEFTEGKQASEETVMRVTHDALDVHPPM